MGRMARVSRAVVLVVVGAVAAVTLLAGDHPAAARIAIHPHQSPQPAVPLSYWRFAAAVDALGTGTYPHLYAGVRLHRNDPVVIYLAHGDDSAFLADVRALASTPEFSQGVLPRYTVVRVPHSISQIDAASARLQRDQGALEQAGYVVLVSMANVKLGTYDVQLQSMPPGTTRKQAARYFRSHVSPLIRITTIGRPSGASAG